MDSSARWTVLSLCSGIGGLDLAVRSVLRGARTVCYVEREAAAAAVLAQRMEEGALDPAPIWTDLRAFDGSAWRGLVDFVAAGIPCQPYSLAGLRRGEADPRNLWPDTARIVGELGRPVFFLENVPGIARYAWEVIIPELAGMGYVSEATLTTANAVGAPHRRERFFLVAVADTDRRGWALVEEIAAVGRDADGVRRPHIPALAYAYRDRDVRGADVGEAAPPDGAHGAAAGSDSGLGSRLGPYPPLPGDLVSWREVLHARPDLAPCELEVCPVADGFSGRLAVYLLGGSVVPQQAAASLVDLCRLLIAREGPP